jgi:hypothetical protein
MRNWLSATVAALMLSSCQTWGPTWSEVTGERFTVPSADFNTAPTAVNLIDGVGSFQRAPGQGGIKVEPGLRVLVLAAAPLSPGWTGGTDLETLRLDFAPCKRYYINARYDTRLSTSWKPFVDHVESIAGCTTPGGK